MQRNSITSQPVSQTLPALELKFTKFAATRELNKTAITEAMKSAIEATGTSKTDQLYETLKKVRNDYKLPLILRCCDHIFNSGNKQKARDALLTLVIADSFQSICSGLSPELVKEHELSLCAAMLKMGECFRPSDIFPSVSRDISINEYTAHALHSLYHIAINPSGFLNLFSVKTVTFAVSKSSASSHTTELQAQVSLNLPNSISWGDNDLSLVFNISAKDWLSNAFCKNYIIGKGVDYFTGDEAKKLKTAEEECGKTEAIFDLSSKESIITGLLTSSSKELEICSNVISESKKKIYNHLCDGGDSDAAEELEKLKKHLSHLKSSKVELCNKIKNYSISSTSVTEKVKYCIETAKSYSTYVEELNRAFLSESRTLKPGGSSEETSGSSDVKSVIVKYEEKFELAKATDKKLDLFTTQQAELEEKFLSAIDYGKSVIESSDTSLAKWNLVKDEHQHLTSSMNALDEALKLKLDYVTDYFIQPEDYMKRDIICKPFASGDIVATGYLVEDYNGMNKIIDNPTSKMDTRGHAIKVFAHTYLSVTKKIEKFSLPSTILRIQKTLKNWEDIHGKVSLANGKLIEARTTLLNSMSDHRIQYDADKISEKLGLNKTKVYRSKLRQRSLRLLNILSKMDETIKGIGINKKNQDTYRRSITILDLGINKYLAMKEPSKLEAAAPIVAATSEANSMKLKEPSESQSLKSSVLKTAEPVIVMSSHSHIEHIRKAIAMELASTPSPVTIQIQPSALVLPQSANVNVNTWSELSELTKSSNKILEPKPTKVEVDKLKNAPSNKETTMFEKLTSLFKTKPLTEKETERLKIEFEDL
ncbi:TPA: hypothetical protein PXM28_003954 [Yersinia enterocolitica]|nr:hypothetical protein [Yersinia enterocolitica]